MDLNVVSPSTDRMAGRFLIRRDGESPLRVRGPAGLLGIRTAALPPTAQIRSVRITEPEGSALLVPKAGIEVPAEFGLDLIGTTVERYRLERRLGAGVCWAAFTARHESLNLSGLVWLLDRNRLPADSAFSSAFAAEAERALALRHTALLVPYVYSITAELAVLVTEWIDPMTAASAAEEARKRPGPHAVEIVQQLAEGLALAHDAGCLHRSLHPGIVFLRPGAKAKLGGLGWPAWLLGDGQWARFDGMPEPWLFCAPERLVDPLAGDLRSDLYSLGAILYYFLTDNPPYAANSIDDLVRRQLAGPPSLPPETYSRQLVDLVKMLLEPDPARRPRDYRFVLPTLQSTFLAERSRLARIKMEGILGDLSAERAARVSGAVTGST